MEKYRKMKRVPIRRRLMFLVLLTTIITAISVMAISITSMVKIKEESEETLTFHLKQNIKSLVEQKALNTDLKLEHYENYIIFITDYIQDMYKMPVNSLRLVSISMLLGRVRLKVFLR